MRELRQRFWLRVSTWITLSACFSVLVGATVAATNLVHFLTLWGDDIQVTAYLSPEANADRIKAIEERLHKDKRAGKVEFVSRERALSEFKTQLASYAPDLAGDEDLLSVIPASFQISLASTIASVGQVEAIRELAESLEKIDGIEEVRYGQEWVKKYAAVVSAARGVFLFVGLVLVLAAFFVIGNTVRASIDARRNEIEVLELVGATQGMIRRPFLIEGAVLGLCSSVSALLIGWILFGGLRDLVSHEMGSALLGQEMSYLTPGMAILVVVGGAFLGVLSSYLCLRRINTGFAAAGGVI